MASAPNLRVVSNLPAVGNGSVAPAEIGDFVSMLTTPLAIPAGDAHLSDGERVTQDNPTGIKFDSDGTSRGANAQDLLAGLIPIVQAQEDYPIAVTFAPAEAETGDADTEEAAVDSGEPTLPIIAPAIAAPIPVAPSLTPSATTTPARTDAAAVPGTPGAAPLAQPVEAKMPAAPIPDPAADPAKPVQSDVAAATTEKPKTAPRPTAIETQTTLRAAAEVAVTDDAGIDPLVKAAEAASQQAASPPTVAVTAETGSRLQALRNALLPLGRATTSRERQRDTGQPPLASAAVEPPRAGEAGAPSAPADIRPAAGETATTPTSVQPLHANMPARPADPAATPAETIDRSIDRALDLARDSEWLDRLSRDIAGAGDKDGILRFRLNPQSLGQLRVELSQTEQGTNVRLAVETEAARALLADAQPRLLAEARAQGVRIAEASVHLAGSEQQPSNDPRRQDDSRQGAMVRTPAGPASELPARERPVRSRSDRYA